MYFEKFILSNTLYLGDDSDKMWWLDFFTDYGVHIIKNFGFMWFNLIFTASAGLGGLTTIPFCLKMIKQGKTKTNIFYILTFIQILLQTTFPFIRAYLVIQNVLLEVEDFANCALVGFQVYSFPIRPYD